MVMGNLVMVEMSDFKADFVLTVMSKRQVFCHNVRAILIQN